MGRRGLIGVQIYSKQNVHKWREFQNILQIITNKNEKGGKCYDKSLKSKISKLNIYNNLIVIDKFRNLRF